MDHNTANDVANYKYGVADFVDVYCCERKYRRRCVDIRGVKEIEHTMVDIFDDQFRCSEIRRHK